MSVPAVTALGWYVVFGHASKMDAMHDHYRGILGLPSYLHWRRACGDAEDKDYFWGGEATILDVNHDGVLTPDCCMQTNPETARQVPIFRVSDIDTLVAGLGDCSTAIKSWGHGREAFVVDPMGMLIGLRQVPAFSPLAPDQEAARRRARGEAFNPGCGPMPAGWQELGWVRLRAAEPLALAEFYRTVLGLPIIFQVGVTTTFDLGDNVTLEIIGGGSRRPPPVQQMAACSAMILRTRDIDSWIARMERHHVTLVGRRYGSPKGDWFYLADPEGNVVGLAERKHPNMYCTMLPVAPEDIEAARREVEAAWVRTRI
jgi:predicted enzyme related to lactoylglutathione lyase